MKKLILMKDSTSLYLTVKVFRKDGKIDMAKLNFLIKMALRDDKIDAQEKVILQDVFDNLPKDTLSEDTKKKISELRSKHNL